MKTTYYFCTIFVSITTMISCKKDVISGTGPMSQRISSMSWVKTELPSKLLTPGNVGYDEQLYRLHLHVYTVRNDSLAIISRFLNEEDNWDNNSFTFHYDDNSAQRFDIVYSGSGNSQSIREVHVHAPYKGTYSARADTSLSYYVPRGEIPQKWSNDEAKRP